MSYIEFNQKKSSDFGIRLYNDLEFAFPKKDIDTFIISGRDGILEIDNKRLEPFKKTFKFDIALDEKATIEGDNGSQIFKKALLISQWLSVKGYQDFKYSMYPDYVWKARFLDDGSIKDYLRWYAKGILKFEFYPVMYFANQEIKDVTSGDILVNNGTLIAKPYFEIFPSDTAFSMQNNGVDWLKMENVTKDQKIIIDSQLQTAVQLNHNMENHMVKLSDRFPLLPVGNNTITFSGINSVKILGRFGVMAI